MPNRFEQISEAIAEAAGSLRLAGALLAVAAFLFFLVVLGLGHRLPALPPLLHAGSRPAEAVPVNKIQSVVSKAGLAQIRLFANAANPFFTKRFEPAPPPPPPPAVAPTVKPEPPPAPPPPVTRKLKLLYQGNYQTAAGEQKAFLTLDSNLAVLTPGAKIEGGWAVANIGMRKLTLTNASAQTNILEFNAVKEIEVPVK